MEQRVRREYNFKGTPITVQSYPLSCANKIWYNNPGVIDNGINGSQRVMSDYVVPRFAKRRAAGERFFNNMFKEEITVSTVGSDYLLTSVADACPGVKALTKIGGPAFALYVPRSVANSEGHKIPLRQQSLSDQDIVRLQKDVSTEVLAKVGTGTHDMWESAAELRRTLEMINPSLEMVNRKVKRILQSMDRGQATRHFFAEVNAGYLMTRYGIMPLIRDIKNTLASLDKDGGTKEVTSRANGQTFSNRVFAGSTASSPFEHFWQCQVNDAVTVRGMSLDRGYVSIANNFGFNLKGLALLPLQLTSYSFVADWFTNLSSYVGATLPTFGWTALGNALVTTRATSTTYTYSHSTNSSPGTITITTPPSGSVSMVVLSTTRAPLMPAAFQMKSDFKFDQFTRTADLCALLATRFAKLGAYQGAATRRLAFPEKQERVYRRWADQPGVL